jgi:hypothetical protein
MRPQVDHAKIVESAFAFGNDDVIREERDAVDLHRGVVIDERFQFACDGFVTGAVTTRKFFAFRLVVTAERAEAEIRVSFGEPVEIEEVSSRGIDLQAPA